MCDVGLTSYNGADECCSECLADSIPLTDWRRATVWRVTALHRKQKNNVESIHDISIEIHDISIEIHDISTEIHDISTEIHDISTEINDISTEIHDISIEIHDISIEIHDISIEIHERRAITV